MPQDLSLRLLKIGFGLLLIGSSFLIPPLLLDLNSTWRALIVEALPLILLSTSFILSIHFNRSRLSFALLFVTIVAASKTTHHPSFSPHFEQLMIACLSANLFIFSLLKDRGLMSIHGALRFSLVALQLTLLWYLFTYHKPETMAVTAPLWRLSALPFPAFLTEHLQLSSALFFTLCFFASLHLVAAFLLKKQHQVTFFHLQISLLAMAATAHSSQLNTLLFCAATMLVLLDIITNSHDMAYRDELTALPSRRALNQLLLSLGRKYTIAMLDIDHFKKFNDTHGHDIGDEVLRMVAAKISAISGGGKAFRYGGEEFTIVFAGKTPDQTEAHLNALRQTIENYSMVLREKRKKNDKEGKSKRGKSKSQQKTLSVTISIGLAERNKARKTPEEVIKAADLALYRAKRAGRNCVSR